MKQIDKFVHLLLPDTIQYISLFDQVQSAISKMGFGNGWVFACIYCTHNEHIFTFKAKEVECIIPSYVALGLI